MKYGCGECSQRWFCDINPNECNDFGPSVDPETNTLNMTNWSEVTENLRNEISQRDARIKELEDIIDKLT